MLGDFSGLLHGNQESGHTAMYKEGRSIRGGSVTWQHYRVHIALTSLPVFQVKTLQKEFIMSAPKTDTSGAEHYEATNVTPVPLVDEKYATGKVIEVQAASVALAAAMAAQKPNLLSKNMLQLYFIMSVGYLISTMNGFGMIT
jgi:hypothetical protein